MFSVGRVQQSRFEGGVWPAFDPHLAFFLDAPIPGW